MTAALILEQLLNGVQLGVMLFLTAAGLTLVFGVMGLINLAHGALFMIGAFVAVTVQKLFQFSYIEIDETKKDFLEKGLTQKIC